MLSKYVYHFVQTCKINQTQVIVRQSDSFSLMDQFRLLFAKPFQCRQNVIAWIFCAKSDFQSTFSTSETITAGVGGSGCAGWAFWQNGRWQYTTQL